MGASDVLAKMKDVQQTLASDVPCTSTKYSIFQYSYSVWLEPKQTTIQFTIIAKQALPHYANVKGKQKTKSTFPHQIQKSPAKLQVKMNAA